MRYRGDSRDPSMSSLPEAGQDIQNALKELERERAGLMREMGGSPLRDLPKQMGAVYQPRKRFVRGSATTILKQQLQEYLGHQITDKAQHPLGTLGDVFGGLFKK